MRLIGKRLVAAIAAAVRRYDGELVSTVDSVSDAFFNISEKLELAEFCCSPQSALVGTLLRRGKRAQRFNLESGHHFDKPATVRNVLSDFNAVRVKRVWASTPCT